MKTSSPHIRTLSWKTCRALIAKLCHSINESQYDPEVVVGIGMGGIPLSLVLRYALGRLPWETLVLKKYHDETHEKPQVRMQVINCTTMRVEGKRILLVDDILGTGDTIAFAKELLSRKPPAEARTAVLLVNRDRVKDVDYWGMRISVETQGPWKELMEIMS